jgi:GT2 family glycosyltransferase
MRHLMWIPEISVVVVAWRARDYVLRCLDALERHVRLPYEAIVVDDGSHDGTGTAVRERFPLTRVFEKELTEGLVAGRNSALPLVTGRYVLMLDADTEVRPNAVEILARTLKEGAGVGLVAPKLVYPDGRLQLSCRRYPPMLLPFLRRGPYARVNRDPAPHRRHLMEDFDHKRERSVVWVAGAAQMWPADLPARIGFYDSRISSYGGEDLDWCLRVWRAGLEVRYVPRAEVVHDWQQVTKKSLYGRQSFRQLRDFYYIQWKHRGLQRDSRLSEANG